DGDDVRGLDLNAFQPRIHHGIPCRHLVEDRLRLRSRYTEVTSEGVGAHAVDAAEHTSLADLSLLRGRVGNTECRYRQLTVRVTAAVVRHRYKVAGQAGGNSDMLAAV